MIIIIIIIIIKTGHRDSDWSVFCWKSKTNNRRWSRMFRFHPASIVKLLSDLFIFLTDKDRNGQLSLK